LTERVWAPWRSEYVKNPDKGGCFLCAARDSKDAAASLVVARRRLAIVVMNRYPYTSGHLMIAPLRHVGILTELTDAEMLEMVRLVRDCEAVFRKVMRPHGMNVGINVGRAAGAGLVGHLHVHVVPRWDGDTNFMTAFADTGVISQGLPEQLRLLTSAFAAKRAASGRRTSAKDSRKGRKGGGGRR